MKEHPLLLMFVAIAFELVGTTSLKLADGAARPMWYIPVALGYAGAMYIFSVVIRAMPLGIAYALWAGFGIVGTALIGIFIFKQHLSMSACIGIMFIIVGSFLINVGPRIASN